MTEIPAGLYFTKSHEWAKIEGEVATLGVSDYAQNELGDITYLELPDPGTTISQGEPLGVIESVKAASDIYSAVSGEIIETNQEVIDSPEFVNSSPYDKAWLVKVRMSDASEVNNLMDSEVYTKFAEEQSGH
ncbi:MAG TPA: glycine cleavage system protein GcvH [Nitrolancea sp.]|nr:glycine cleavage system protein GcvH [Nitrolancea sp.]